MVQHSTRDRFHMMKVKTFLIQTSPTVKKKEKFYVCYYGRMLKERSIKRLFRPLLLTLNFFIVLELRLYLCSLCMKIFSLLTVEKLSSLDIRYIYEGSVVG